MHEFTNGWKVAYRVHQFNCDVDGVRGHKTHSFEAGDLIELVEKIVKKALPFGLVFAVAVDVLSQEGNFFVALMDEACAFFHDAFRGTGNLLTSSIGHYAIGTKLVAAADDRDKGLDGIIALGDQII